jgi:hypothetical protein
MGPGVDKMKQYFWDGKSSIEDHLKSLKEARESIKAELYKYSQYLKLFGVVGKVALQGMGVDVDELTKSYNALGDYIEKVQYYVEEKDTDKKKGGSKSDDRLSQLNEIEKSLTEINKKYDELKKKEGDTQALKDVNKLYASQLKQLNKIGKKYGLKFDMPTNFDDLQKYRQQILDVINKLKMKGYEKGAVELEMTIGTDNIDKLQAAVEKQLKELADKISQTKIAKEFYDKILSQTGDMDIAARISLSIFGGTGSELFAQQVEQIKKTFQSGDKNVKIDLSSAIDEKNEIIHYEKLAEIYEKYKNNLIESNADTAKKIIQDGQKASATQIENWEKEYAKAKELSEQRIDIIKKESEARIKIIQSDLPQADKDMLIAASEKNQNQQLADLDVKEFQSSQAYIKMFEDLDNAATRSLVSMREAIKNVIALDKDMKPENMKAMVEALQKIDDELTDRSVFGNFKDGFLGMFKAVKALKAARQNTQAAKSEYAAAKPGLDIEADVAQTDKAAADASVLEQQQQLLAIEAQIAELRANGLEDSEQMQYVLSQQNIAQQNLTSALTWQQRATANVAKTEEKRKKYTDKINAAQEKENEARDASNKSQNKLVKGAKGLKEKVESVKSTIAAIAPLLGDLTEEGTELGDTFTQLLNALDTFCSLMTVAQTLMEAFNVVCDSNPWVAIAAAVLTVANLLAGMSGAAAVRKANKEIEKQKYLLEDLQYAYEKLGDKADESFGSDYINTINAQRRNLYLQYQAYVKQAESEMTKGKKTDNDKVQDYLDSARDALDDIDELASAVSEKMLGSDLASAASDFAQAWLDAYKEFSSVTSAMTDEFEDMIENMVVNSVLGQVMKKALQPAFDMIDSMNESDFYNQSFWENVVKVAQEGAENASNGAQVMMNFLEAAGINLRDTSSELSGVSRDIASASEESINGLAAGINTQNYYIAQMLTYVKAIALGDSNMALGPTDNTYVDLLQLQNQHLSNLPQIATNTAQTAAAAERVSELCNEVAVILRSVTTTRNSQNTSNKVINISKI